MKLCFDSVQEVRDFVKSELKGTRGKKDDGTDTDTSTAALNIGTAGATGNAPPPLQPPQGGSAFAPGNTAAFAPPAGAGFPGNGGVQVDPAVTAVVARISAAWDKAVGSGQPADVVLNWFRSQLGAEAANATQDQIRGVLLPKASIPTLENLAKLMNA